MPIVVCVCICIEPGRKGQNLTSLFVSTTTVYSAEIVSKVSQSRTDIFMNESIPPAQNITPRMRSQIQTNILSYYKTSCTPVLNATQKAHKLAKELPSPKMHVHARARIKGGSRRPVCVKNQVEKKLTKPTGQECNLYSVGDRQIHPDRQLVAPTIPVSLPITCERRFIGMKKRKILLLGNTINFH